MDQVYEDITVPEFKALIGTENTVLLDVRAPGEAVEGDIEGKQLVDFYEPDFTDRIGGLDRDKTYLVYCRSGNRSGQTCRLMVQLGFKKAYNLKGGIQAWNQQS